MEKLREFTSATRCAIFISLPNVARVVPLGVEGDLQIEVVVAIVFVWLLLFGICCISLFSFCVVFVFSCC